MKTSNCFRTIGKGFFAGLLLCLFSNTAKAQSWYNNSWQYRKAITIDYTKVGAGPHTNFPVLISITDADLHASAQTTGNDILFTSSDGTTKISHEIETYTTATGVLVAWVEVPSLSSAANTVIYMYYGNAAAANQQDVTGTWDASFSGVYHMNTFSDATSNARNGANIGTIAATGQIGAARGFVTSNGADKITIAGLMGNPVNSTLSGWGNLNTRDFSGSALISLGDVNVINMDDNTNGCTAYYYNSAAGSKVTSVSPVTHYAGAGWHYIVYTNNDAGDAQKIYVDGVLKTTTAYTPSVTYSGLGANTIIGGHANGSANFDFDGNIDEVRVASAVRSDGWILTEYNNQNLPGTFLSVGNQTTACSVTNLLLNPGFESPVVPNLNSATLENIQTGTTWGNWTVSVANGLNVVKVNGAGYVYGADRASDGFQYIDLTNAATNLSQTFTLAQPASISFSGNFSNRQSASGSYIPWSGYIQIINASAAVVATSNTVNMTNALGDEAWFNASGNIATLLPAGTYTYKVFLGDYGHFDNASVYINTSVSGTSTPTCVGGGSTGTITATATGGYTPYTYSLNGGAYQASATFTGLAAGSYTLTAKSNTGCISSGTVTVTVIDFGTSPDNQNLAGTNTWVGHVYDGTAFNNYIGNYTEAETFDELFGGSTTCFNLTSNAATVSIYTETFSVKYRMNSTKVGLYVVDPGSDDGSRLTVDTVLIYNKWVDQSFTVAPRVLLNLSGTSSLLFEYYENGGGNEAAFQNLTLVLANRLAANTTQSICIGNSGAAISGDVYGVLPAGITVSGTGYQWSYSTTPLGTRTAIAGATGAAYTPSAAAAPFNTAGTFYFYRNAVLSSTNNVSPNPYVATNESNAATITVTALPSATISYAGNPYCANAGTATVTRTGTAGGTYSSTAGLTINTGTGLVTLGTSTAGTYTVTYTIAASGGCSVYTITTPVIINPAPSATISYSGSPFCTSAGTAAVTFSGTAGGVYSSTAGLVINAVTGEVNLNASTAGTYTITYTVAAAGGCALYTVTAPSITITASPAISQLPAGSLISYYKFNGNANDATGNNNGILQNNPAPTTDRFGVANSAYTFNGTSNYVATSTNYPSTQDLTISLWLKTATVSGGFLIGFGDAQTGPSGAHDRDIFMNAAGQLAFNIYTGFTSYTVISPLSYNDNNWHLATATLSSTTGLALYADGALVGSNPFTGGAQTHPGYWRIGYENLGYLPSNYFGGVLDDALIYQRALTASEVAVIYTSPDGAGNNGPVCAGSPITLTSNTIAGATYAWSGPNGFTSTAVNPTFAFTAAAIGPYKLQVTAGGCTSTAYTNVAASTTTGQWAGNVSTDWSNANNWCSGTVPTSTTNVTIAAGAAYMPNIITPVFCNNLTINTGATVTTSLAGTLNIAGTLTNNGTITNNGTTNFNGTSGQQTFTGVSQFYNLTVSNTGGLLLPVAITVNNNLTIAAGILTANNFNIAVKGNWINNAAATAFAAGNATVTFSGTTAQTIGGTFTTGFNNLTISNTGNTVSLLVNANISGDLFIGSGTFDLAAFTANRVSAGGVLTVSNNATLKIGGTNSFPVNYATNTLSASGTVEYSGTNQTVANQVYGNLTMSSSSGAAVKTMPATALTVTGNLTTALGAGTSVSFTAAANITVVGNVVIGASTTFNAGSYAHSIGGNWANSGTFNGNTGTITFTGPGATVGGSGVQNFNNLTVAASAIIFANNAITLTGNLATTGSGSFSQTSGGTLTMSGAGKTISGTGIAPDNLTISGSVTTAISLTLTGNLSVSGSFTASAGTITMSGTAKTISGAGTKIFAGLFITGSVTTDAGFSISSSLTVNGSLLATAGTATFTGTATLSGTPNLFNVIINGTSLQLASNSILGIANLLTITAGVLNVTASVPNTVNFNGTGAQNINAITYDKLILSNGNSKTALGAITANNDLTIGTGTTFIAGGYTHTCYHNWINSGTFTAGAGTILFKGSGITTITGATAFNVLAVDNILHTNELQLLSDVSAATVNMISGTMNTLLNKITITTTRTGVGIIYGTIQRTHAFTTGVAYAFEGPYNTITFASVTGVTSVTVYVLEGAVPDFPFGGSISRVYSVTVPAGTYNATLRLHYEHTELNGNNELTMALWNYNGTTWNAIGKTANDATNNYVELSGMTTMSNRYTLSDDANAVVWNGSVSTDWNTAANWTVLQGSGSRPPGPTDIVDLGTATFTNQPTISTAVTIKSILFGSAKAVTLTMAAGGSLVSGDIKGTWAANATHTINVNNQTITVNGELQLSDGTAGHAINLNIGGGTVNATGLLTESGGANITFTGAGLLSIGDNFNYSSGTFTAGSGTVVYNAAGDQVVAAVAYNNLTISKATGIASVSSPLSIAANLAITGGELDNSSVITIAGNTTISAGALIQNTGTIYEAGNWTNNGTPMPAGGSIYFNGTGTQLISATTFNNLFINKPVGSVARLTGNVILQGNLSIMSGTLDVQTYYSDRTLMGGTLTMGDSGTVIVGTITPPVNFATYIISTSSTIILSGTGQQFLGSTGTPFGNLIFRNAGAKTLVTPIAVAGNFTIENGSNFDAGSQTLTLDGNWINYGTFIPSASTVIVTGTGKTITGNNTFHIFSVNGSDTLLNNTTFDSLLTVNTGGYFYAGSTIAVTMNGDFTNKGTLITLGTTTFTGSKLQTLTLNNAVTAALTVNFNGSVSPITNANSPIQFGYLNINNSGGVNPNAGITVLYDLTVGPGASFNGGTSTHNFMSNLTNNGTITSSGTINFIPAAATTLALGNFSSTGLVVLGGSGALTTSGTAVSFHDIIISNTNPAGLTPATSLLITNNLTINNGSILNGANGGLHIFAIGGNIVNNGTVNPGTSTIYLNGTGQQDISGLSAGYNLTINKASGFVNLFNSVTLTGVLNFVKGLLVTNNNNLILTSAATVTGAAQTTGWVNGNLKKSISTGAATQSFEMGDSVSYTPVSLVFANVSTGGYFTASTKAGDHPNINSSTINRNKSVNRYWTLTNSGVVYTNYAATLNFKATDIDAGASTSNFGVGLYNGSSWTMTAVAAPNATNITATAVTATGDFAIGEICNAGTIIVYSGSPYCSGSGTASVSLNGTGGGVFSSTAGLVINAGTGAIDLALSTTGTYIVKYTVTSTASCNDYFTTTTITINTAPVATIAYTGNPYCANAGTLTVTRTGTTGGTYSSTAGLTINAATGDITTGTSTAGTYTVTYTIAAAGGCAVYTVTTSVTITAVLSATISYAGSPYCSSAGTATVTRTGTAGGVYSSTSGLTINAATGAITLGTSTPGAYTITYTIAATGGCAGFTTTTTITVTLQPNATGFYAGSPYCSNGGIAYPSGTATGAPGTLSSTPTGLALNSSTGAVDLGASTPGTYTVTYTVPASGGCGVFTNSSSITVTAMPAASISYPGSPYYTGSGNALVSRSGTAGGTYSSTAGLTINAATGTITLGTSTAGTYIVTYTIAATGGCAGFATTASVSITNIKTWDGGAGTNNWGDANNWNPDGVPTASENVDLSGAFTININVAAVINNITLNNAGLTLTVNAGNSLAVSGNLTLSAGVLNTAALFPSVAGTVNVAAGTVGFTGSVVQTIPAYNYNNLTSSSTGGRILAGSGTIGIAGIFTAGTNTYTTTGSTVNFNGSGAQTIPALNYNNLTLSNSGMKTFSAGTTGIAGNLLMTGTAGVDALTNTSVINYNGAVNQTAGDFNYYNLSVSSTGGTVTAPANLNISNNFVLASGTFAAGATINIAGNWTNNGNFIAGGSGVTFNGSLAQIISGSSATVFNYFTAANTAGINAGNITINGELNLQSANPSSVKGVLDMGLNTLNMGATSTTSGQGDVTGIVRRTTILPDIAYTFGNQFTSATLQNVGTLPAELSFKIRIGAAPSWKTDAIKRVYDISFKGGLSFHGTARFHYLDSELNGNIPEENLSIFHYVIPASYLAEDGKSNFSTTDNWVALANLVNTNTVDSLDFGTVEWTLATQSTINKIWTGSNSTDWTNPLNWTGGVPGPADNVIIPDASTTSFDPALPDSATIYTLTINSAAIVNGGTGKLFLAGANGAWIDDGIFNHDASTIIFTNAAATIAGNSDFYNVTINAGAELTMSGQQLMQISGTIINNGIWNVSFTDNTVEYTGDNQTVINPNGGTGGYYHLITGGGGVNTMPATPMNILGNFTVLGTATTTALAPLTIDGTVNIEPGATFNAGSFNHSLKGDWNNTGTFVPGTSTITFNGNSLQFIEGSTASDFYNLIIANNGSSVIANNNSVIIGNLSITSGVFDLGSYTANRASAGGTFTLSNSAALKTGGTNTFPSNYSTHSIGATSIIEYSGINQTVAVLNSAQSYGNLIISGSGIKTLAGTENVIGNLTISSGTFDLGSNTINRASAGGTLTVSNGGALKIGGTNTIPSNYSTHSIGAASTIEYSGTNQTVAVLNSSQNYGNLTISALLAQCNTDIAAAGNVTVTTGTFNINTYTLKIGGAIINTGIFIATNGTIQLNGLSAQVIPAAVFSGNTINGLGINNTAGVTLGGALSLTDVLTVSNGSLETGGYLTLKSSATAIARVATITSLSATPITGNVMAERYIPGRRKYRLITSDVTTNSSTVLIAGQENLSIWGNWQNQGNNTTGNTGTIITGGTAADGFDTPTGNASLYTYDDVNRKYTGYTSANGKNTKYTALKAGVAYYMFVYGDRLNSVSTSTPNNTVIKQYGKLLTGDQVYNISSPMPLSNVVDRYTMLGNPFASPIDWASLPKTNISNTFWGWDPNLSSTGGYVTVSTAGAITIIAPFSGTTGLNQYIQPGQGFFVRTTASFPALTITEQNKVANFNPNAFRTSGTLPLLAINLLYTSGAATVLADGVVAAFDAGFSAQVNDDDALKMANNNEVLSIVNGSNQLSIEARPLPHTNDTLFLNMAKVTRPQYTLQIFAQQMESVISQAYLEDNYLGTSQLLSLSDTNYVIFIIDPVVPASSAAGRFRVVFHPLIVLPLIFTSVNAVKQNREVEVSWSVSSESGIQNYEVQKSVDGTSFITVATTPATGSNSPQSYSWLDQYPVTGNNFYRIRAVEISGNNILSKIVLVNMDTVAVPMVIKIFPNPVINGQVNVSITGMEKGGYDFLFVNIAGQQLMKKTIIHPGGPFNQNFSLSNNLKAGIYYLNILFKNNRYVQTFFIE